MEAAQREVKPAGKAAYAAEGLPEPLRLILKQRMAALKPVEKGRPRGQEPGESPLSPPPALLYLMDLILKASAKPGPAVKPIKTYGFPAEGGETAPPRQTLPGPIRPASSGWLVWILAGLALAGAIFCYRQAR